MPLAFLIYNSAIKLSSALSWLEDSSRYRTHMPWPGIFVWSHGLCCDLLLVSCCTAYGHCERHDIAYATTTIPNQEPQYTYTKLKANKEMTDLSYYSPHILHSAKSQYNHREI